MIRTRVVRTVLVVLVAALTAPAAAHHGWSGYSDTAERFTGEVRAVEYGNPHVTIELQAKERTWRVVLAPPSRMERRGLAKDALAVGEKATIEAYRHEREPGELRAEWIELRGKRTELR